MPVLDASQPLPDRPSRVLVCGSSGAGKTTLADRIAGVLGAARVELDSLYHGPGWVPRPSFTEEVMAFVAGPTWVLEWQYTAVREALLDRADLLVWLDLPRRAVMRQIVARTARRRLHRTVLWNGNVEPPLRTVLTDREHIVRWAWSDHPKVRGRVAVATQRRPELPVVRLPSHADGARWIAGPLAEAADRPASPRCASPRPASLPSTSRRPAAPGVP